jgi:hypothetical protein
MPKILEKFEISNGYDKYSLDSAKRKANSLRSELDGDNPILAIIGSNTDISVSSLLSEPYVIKRDLPFTINTH